MSDTSRRLIGTLFGLMMGLLFGIISTMINSWALPGVPLVEPQLGWAGSVIAIAFGGALLGIIAAWPDDAIPGVIVSAIAGALMSTIAVVNAASGSAERAVGTITLLVITFLPRAFLFVPVAGIVRWTLGIWENELGQVNFSIRKLGLTLGLLLVIATAGGAFYLYDRDTRNSFRAMNDLVQAALPATSMETLPEELHGVDDILTGLRGDYTLELWREPDDLPVQRPMVTYTVPEWAIIARFENGFKFGCAFSTAYGPQCGEF